MIIITTTTKATTTTTRTEKMLYYSPLVGSLNICIQRIKDNNNEKKGEKKLYIYHRIV